MKVDFWKKKKVPEFFWKRGFKAKNPELWKFGSDCLIHQTHIHLRNDKASFRSCNFESLLFNYPCFVCTISWWIYLAHFLVQDVASLRQDFGNCDLGNEPSSKSISVTPRAMPRLHLKFYCSIAWNNSRTIFFVWFVLSTEKWQRGALSCQ